jgi:predicted MPP superfamily phosphohydrolase
MLRILVGAVLWAALHYYVWWRLISQSELPRRWRRGVGIAMAVLFVSISLVTSARMWAPGFASVLAWFALPWLAFVGLLALILLALEVPRWAAPRLQRARPTPAPPHGVSRRQFLAGAAATVAGASVVRGMAEARGEHEVVDIEVKLAKLPRALDGFSIVQLSDLHVGLTIDRGFVQRVVDHANALSPDLIVLTGDVVDGYVDRLRDDAAPLAELRARHGVYAVTGNHEYYVGVDEWIEALSALGVRYLRNERVAIGDGEATFDLAGVDDHTANRWPGHGEDLSRALDGRDRSRAVVLLAHQPRQVRRARHYGVDLQLSGHTHGGQIWPWHYIVRVQQGGLLAGRYTVDATQLYVTRGCGYWGPPVRLLAPLEITRVILRAA